MRNRLLVALACGGVLAGPAVAPAAAAAAPGGESPTCGSEIDTSVTLHADLACSGPVFLIGGSSGGAPVVVDLGRHTIRSTSGTTTLLMTGGDGLTPVTVRSGTVVPPPDGVAVQAPGGPAVTFRSMTFLGNVITTFVSSTFDGDRFLSGAGLYGNSTVATVRHSHFVGTATDRFAISLGFTEATVTDSTIDGYAVGIALSDFQGRADFERNRISGAGTGIEMNYGANPGVISGNRVVGSTGDGILLGQGSGIGGPGEEPPGLTVSANVVSGNGGDGIHVDPVPVMPYGDFGIDVTLTGNRADYNGRYGIESPGDIPAQNVTVTDGGGNRARGNGETPQCLNVAC